MDKNNNIYNYKAPKSMNEETHYFLIKGRITRKSFFFRFLFAVIVHMAIKTKHPIKKRQKKPKKPMDKRKMGNLLILRYENKLSLSTILLPL